MEARGQRARKPGGHKGRGQKTEVGGQKAGKWKDRK